MTVAWHGLVCLVFLFAAWVGVSLATGSLDPLGNAYYGVMVSSRESVLFALLAALQSVSLVDGVALGWRRRRGVFWAGLVAAVLIVPFGLVLAMARLDVWRYERRAFSANLVAGSLTMVLLLTAFLLRRWAWRFSGSIASEP